MLTEYETDIKWGLIFNGWDYEKLNIILQMIIRQIIYLHK